MKFSGRDKEIQSLQTIRERSKQNAQMTVVTGRRRVGKTRLIKESLSEEKFLYFFLSRKDEPLLCDDFKQQIEQTLGLELFGSYSRFSDLFAWLCDYAKREHLNVVIDEFQEFFRINPSVFSEMQNLWDSSKDVMKMNLILSGSIQSLMRKIFDNYREPLFGRATAKMKIKPFGVGFLKELMRENYPNYEPIDLLTFYVVTGGVAKYVEYFVDNKQLAQEDFFNVFLDDISFFQDEGKALLIEEFGKDYRTYFSILALIAAGKTSRSAITSVIQRDVGGQLKRLEEDYSIIKARRPIFSKPASRNIKFFIDDNFLNFWFRFIFKYKAALELANYDTVLEIMRRDFPTYAGPFLEKFIRKSLAESKEFTAIGNYWERGNQNEIDIVAYNELSKKALICEVKMNKKNISLDVLRSKAIAIGRNLGGYDIDYRGYSLADITNDELI